MLNTYNTDTGVLSKPLTLPCGAVIKNRFFKSAMSEGLGTVDNKPTPHLSTLYDTFAQGGSGIVVTGNVMVDSKSLGEPRNVVVEDESNLEALKDWARAGTQENTHLWMQLNHPGKQIPSFLSREPVAPSAIPLSENLEKFFNPPKELQKEEIHDLIQRFATSAGIAKNAGFSGVQIHGAHGYLVSEFLSPHHNQRTDEWGGSLENRMRFVLEIYDAIRNEVGNNFPVGIKLNSADFQKGGFTNEESLGVIKALSEKGIDLIEISGGNYENPAMTGSRVRESTRKREAYFLEFAQKVREHIDTPLVVTGGFRSAKGMTEAINSNSVDMVGLARPLAVDPYLPGKILAGEDYKSSVKPLSTGFRVLDTIAMLEITWYEQQLERISRGKSPKPNKSPWASMVKSVVNNGVHTFQKRRAN